MNLQLAMIRKTRAIFSLLLCLNLFAISLYGSLINFADNLHMMTTHQVAIDHHHHDSFSLHIDEKVPRANFEMELSNLIKEAKIGAHDAIAYSGNLGLMPYVAQSPSHELLWLPGPLQLLEVPVPPERQAEIIQRSIERGRPLNKYLVHAKKEVEDRYENWIDSLQNYFIKTATFESEHWIIIKYQEKI